MHALTVLTLILAVLGGQGRTHGMRRAWCICIADGVVGKPWGACRVGHAGAFVARHAAGAVCLVAAAKLGQLQTGAAGGVAIACMCPNMIV